jgi:hypothetical protein
MKMMEGVLLTLSDAQAAVASGSGGKRAYRGHVLSFDLGNEERGTRRERRNREVIRRRSPSPRTDRKRRSRTPSDRPVRKWSRSNQPEEVHQRSHCRLHRHFPHRHHHHRVRECVAGRRKREQ